MRRIPDIIILVGVITGAAGISTGHRWIGGISLLVALVVGWKRNWCLATLEDMICSSESSAVNRMHSSEADHDIDGEPSSSAGSDAAAEDEH